MEDEIERQNRVLLRPWLESMLQSNKIHGLVWHDHSKTMFRVPWKHRSKKDWSVEHCSVFVEWAKNTGRWSEDSGTPNFAQLKTRLRCAFNKAPDIEEMKELHCNNGEEPYKVYRFRTRKDVSLRKTKHKAPTFATHRYRNSAGVESSRDYDSGQEMGIAAENTDSKEGMMEKLSFLNITKDERQDAVNNNRQKMVLSRFHADLLPNSGDCALDIKPLIDSDKGGSLPFIPLSVEMLSASSDSNGSECGSPLCLSPVKDETNELANAPGLDRSSPVEVSRIKACKEESFHLPLPCKSVTADYSSKGSLPCASKFEVSLQEQLSPKEHMLQLASLFVEAGEKITQRVSSPMNPALQMTKDDFNESDRQNRSGVIVVSPEIRKAETNDPCVTGAKEIQCSNITQLPQLLSLRSTQMPYGKDLSSSKVPPGYCAEPNGLSRAGDVIDLTCKTGKQFGDEPIDLTKKAIATQIRPMTCDAPTDCPDFAKSGADEGNSSQKLINSILGDIDLEDFIALPSDTLDTMRAKAKRSEHILLSKAKMLCLWEERLKRWEAELKATEMACFWKNKFLETELAKNGVSVAEYEQARNMISPQNSAVLLNELQRPSAPRIMLPGQGFPRRIVTQIRPIPHSNATAQANLKNATSKRSPPVLQGVNCLAATNKPRLTSSPESQESPRKPISQNPGCNYPIIINKSVVNSGLQFTNAPMVFSTDQPRWSKVSSPVQLNKISTDAMPSLFPLLKLDNNSDKRSVSSMSSGVDCKEIPLSRDIALDSDIDEKWVIPESVVPKCAPSVISSPAKNPQILPSSLSSFSVTSPPKTDARHSSAAMLTSGESSDVRVTNSRALHQSPPKDVGPRTPGGVKARCDSDCESGLVIQTSDEEEDDVNQEKEQNKIPNRNSKQTECENEQLSFNYPKTEEHSSIAATTLRASASYPLTVEMSDFPSGTGKTWNFSSPSKTAGSHSERSLEDFTEWLHKKTKKICESYQPAASNSIVSLNVVRRNSDEKRKDEDDLQEKTKRKWEQIGQPDCSPLTKRLHRDDN